MLSSRYNKFQTIITIIAATVFILIPLAVIAKKHSLIMKDFLGVFTVFLMGIYLLFLFFYRSPRITFNESSINIARLFKSSTYTWEQVTNVFLSKKEYYSVLFIFGQTLEAMKLIFNDGKVLVVWGDMYRNMDDMRAFVAQKLNDKMLFLKPANERHLKNMFIDKRYSGNIFTSFNTLLIAGMIIFFFVNLKLGEGKELLLLIPFFFILMMYLGLGTQMNFFEISLDKLIIRNHYFPWKRKEYNIADIEEVSMEGHYRRSNGLRIITYQFQSKFYGAGSLRDHTWSELLDDLGSLGIKTKND